MIAGEPLRDVALSERLGAQRAAFARARTPSARERRAHLRALERAVKKHAAEIARAIDADFGHRSIDETQLLEIFPTLEAARHARRRLAGWMKPRREPVAPYFWPGRARVIRQPLGVVGIIVPWNYPLLLALGPLIGALSAGNRAMIKMSELSPNITELLARIMAGVFAADHVCVVGGGAEVGKAFAALPFDHLVFTGSTETGRSVMHAAAGNLTPVTLELGGKSPAIIGPDAPIESAASRILSAKCRNAGQTCIAPDYVLLPYGSTGAFIDVARAVVGARYPAIEGNPDYSSVVSAAHAERLARLLKDATAKGATVVALHPQSDVPGSAARTMPPAAVIDVRDDMRIMHEEIFGPLLPIRTYRTLAEAIAYVNARPRPLALYYFGQTNRDIETVLTQTHSGGACVNDAMLQFAQDALPFGGIGPSGMGAYHGRAGFEAFSHRKAVFDQAKRNATGLLEPPYGRRFRALLRLITR